MGYFNIGGTGSTSIQKSKWTGRLWTVIGDSNTESNFRANKKYHDYIKDIIDCDVDNQGLSGTGWCTDYSSEPSFVAFHKRLDRIDTNTDLITVLGGGNDYAANVNIGEFGDQDPNESFYGALDYTLKTLTEMFHDKTIAILTQFRRNLGGGEITNDRIEAQVEAQLKVSDKYGIPCLNLYHTSNQYPWINEWEVKYMPDGRHLNDLGQKKLADKILPFLEII